MASSEFADHVIDLLHGFGNAQLRRMFGGHGVFRDGLMFGLISADELYLKVDEQNRADFEAAGSSPFTYRKKTGTQGVMSYWLAPEEVFDDPDQLHEWARSAFAAAKRAKKPRTARFGGFSRELSRYLKALGRNNEKTWFDANRDQYEEHYIEPAKLFVESLGSALRKISKNVQAEARVNGSIMRINRDIRFAKDKTPYKTALHLVFWEGSAPKEGPAFYFRFAAEDCDLAAGLFGFNPKQLAAYRKAVLDPRKGRALRTAIEKSSARGSAELGGAHYRRVPRGFDADHPNADLLKHNGLWVGYNQRHPKELFGKSAVEYCAQRYKELRPVQKWLVDNL